MDDFILSFLISHIYSFSILNFYYILLKVRVKSYMKYNVWNQSLPLFLSRSDQQGKCIYVKEHHILVIKLHNSHWGSTMFIKIHHCSRPTHISDCS